jgi:three-Cys-motif partner protein
VSEVHYQWARGEQYPAIQQHSVVKHEILHSYLTAYIQTLISNPNREAFRLALVDGFAGGGVYQHDATGKEILGSPFIMLQAAKEAEFLVNKDRHKPVVLDLDYFFIEADKGAATLLEHELKERGYGDRLNCDVFLRNSTFEEQADSIIEYIQRRMPRAGRAIFLLDQYGYSKVPVSLIRKILQSLPGAEVILNFGVDSLLNYISDKKEVTQNLLDKIGTPEALRGRTIEDIKRNERDWRLFIQSCLYKDLVESCGAKYYTLFFIRSTKAHGNYWLIHFSQKARARDVMTRIHWEKNTSFIHYGGAGMNMFQALGYVPKHDESFTGQQSLGFCFDEGAHSASVSALMEQIPRLIYPDPDGMTFGELFATTCNMSPASANVYREAIGQAMSMGDLEAISHDGVARRSANRIHDTDLIIPSRQRRLLF